MAYYPTKEKAQIGAEIARQAVEAFGKGEVLRIEPSYARAYHYATKVREAFKALQKHFSELVPAECEDFIHDQMWIVTVLERENAVIVRPRGDIWHGKLFGETAHYTEATRASQTEKAQPLSCAGRPMKEPDNMVWLVSRLMEGHREFTDFEAPKREDVAKIINKHVIVANVVLEIFDPPERVTFRDAQAVTSGDAER